MGTRADFYLGRGADAQWLGSIAWDGYPAGLNPSLLADKSEATYFLDFALHISTREDFTSPEEGWPWPWDNSHTTDYAYAFDAGQVWCCHYGYEWFKADEPQPANDRDVKKTVFPDMRAIKNVARDAKKSGIIILTAAPNE